MKSHLKRLAARKPSNKHVAHLVDYLHGEPGEGDERYDQENDSIIIIASMHGCVHG
jgi:hypothetical protein